MNGHPRDQAEVSAHCRWPLIRGNLTLQCVGRGIDNVAVQCIGRSRRGSPKAGTTVLKSSVVFINVELSLIVNMLVRIWIKHMRLRVGHC